MTPWLLTLKPSFLTELQSLPAKEAHQVQDKLVALMRDPLPDGKVKKRLSHMGGVCRIRSGDYRIFYAFEAPYVSLLGVRKRDEATYAKPVAAELLGGPSVDSAPDLPDSIVDVGGGSGVPATPPPVAPPDASDWLKPTPPVASLPLPVPITVELLEQLAIPRPFHRALVAISNEDELLDCPEVPPAYLDKLLGALFPRPLHEVLAQPNLVANSVDDLLLFKEGKLLGFLLDLSPAQKKYVAWSKAEGGPTLLKGGPGTGKSTIGLHRVKSLIDSLKARGEAAPRVLFTTYTTALVRFSEQLLESLLGAESSLCTVRTADSLAKRMVDAEGRRSEIMEGRALRDMLSEVVAGLAFEGNRLQQKAKAEALRRLGHDYLLDEIGTVIEARRIASEADYLVAPRPGRRVALNATQRSAIWKAAVSLRAALRRAGKLTWPELRARAATLVENNRGEPPYDAVLIDEAQDLEPSQIQMLVGLCKSPHRLFLTADANQSVYGGSFRWSDVHAALRFTGRTGVLRQNHRSTKEIGEAAAAYLRAAGEGPILDPTEDADVSDSSERAYVHTGPLPVVRAVPSLEDEVALIARFFAGASRALRLGLGSAAVLTPSERAGRQLASSLTRHGTRATFMYGRDLDLSHPGIKVLTLASSKGLELPMVALAGFLREDYPVVPSGTHPGTDEGHAAEAFERARRTMFVGMTRAMRALLVVVPAKSNNPLFSGMDPRLWNTGS